MMIVRPERDEELRLEAASRAAGGPFAYRGIRECPTCECFGIPQHLDDGDDRQTCEHCGADLPGPVTWMIRDNGDRQLFILRQGDRCISGGAPVRTSDDDVNLVLADQVWLNLEHRLGLVTIESVRAGRRR